MTELDEPADEPVGAPGRVAMGVVGLGFAGLAAACIPCGLVTWALTWFAVAPLALGGLFCGVFSHGGRRLTTVALNFILVLVGVAFWAVVASGR